LRVLFVNQGRAAPGAALGLLRVQQAVECGMPDGGDVDATFATLPRHTLGQRVALRRVPGVGHRDFWTFRWHVVRGSSARRLISAYLRREGADVVHVTTDQISLLLPGLERRAPYVLNVDITTYDWVRLLRRLPPDAPMPTDLRPLWSMERRALRRAPLCIAWTDAAAAGIRRLAPEANVTVLHPGIDVQLFRPRSGPRRPGPMRVLFVGGRWKDKGGPELVEALRPYLGRSIELHVLTDAQVSSSDGVITHAGRPGSRAVAALFADADVFALPTFADGAPFAVAEGLATGLPIVATDIASLSQMVGGDCGILVKPGDVTGVRTAVLELLADDARRQRMGAAGRARAEIAYNAARNTPKLLELLRGVAEAASRDRRDGPPASRSR
jgi:glycosyltransferase involved in cell wall biosynthesis